ncbi:MAG: hypothetical protein WC141_00305 [Arcobacteraceae bacterium]
MYIQSMFSYIKERQSTSQYKQLLKPLCALNLRRTSKFNLMAIYGAINTLNRLSYGKELSIYIASEYGCVEDLFEVLRQIKEEESILMPFDFLNVNTNNTGFFIAQALDTNGNNINVSSENFSFEKAFELAYFNFQTQNKNEILIGAVDESVEEIPNHNSIINNLENATSKDGSSWLYINNKKENSIAKVKSFNFFTNLKELNQYLKEIAYGKIGLNQYARKYQSELEIDKDLILKNEDNFYGTYSASDIIDLLNQQNKLSIYISLDSKKRAYLFWFEESDTL